MLLLRGADEAVERDVEALVHLLEAPRVAGRRAPAVGSPSASRGLHHLQAVLVGAGQEEHVLAVEPLKARQRIGRDRLIGVADMRHAVRIGDRGRDVEGVAARRRPARLCGAERLSSRGVPSARLRGGVLATGGCFRRRNGFFDFALLRGFLRRLLGSLFATGFFAVFFAAFLAAFFAAFFAVFLRLLRRRACSCARFFAAAALAARAATCEPSSPFAFSKFSS